MRTASTLELGPYGPCNHPVGDQPQNCQGPRLDVPATCRGSYYRIINQEVRAQYQTASFGIRPTPVSDLGRDKLPTFLDIAWQILFRLGFPVARIWWRLQRRRHVGALVAIHVGQSLLLLRSSYRSAWNFPGGSVRQGETPEVSVRRELAEETGLVANAPLRLVGEVCGVWDGRIDRVFLFVLRLNRLPALQLDNREIIGAQLVPIDDLHKVPLTGPVQAYVRGQFSPIDGGAAQSFS